MSELENQGQEEQQQTSETTESVSNIEKMNALWEEEAKELSSGLIGAGKAIIELVKGQTAGVKVNQQFINQQIVEIDQLISKQMDAILHNKDFQKLESAWRGLFWMVERTDFKENIMIEIISASKDDLLQDFEKSIGDTTTTGLYHHIYSSQYGAPNGKPYGAMVLNYHFSNDDKDVNLLSNISEVANMAHAPVISAIAPEFFGPKGYEHLTDAKYSVKNALAGPQYAKWNGFRESENSRYVGLVAPHFLLRKPYSENDVKEFNYQENIDGKNTNYLWGNAAFTFANRITDSFKKYRWCWRILGEESGGKITNMNVHVYKEHGETIQKPPTDIALAFGKENELFENGMIPLCWLRGKDQTVFYRAPSVKSRLEYPDTPEGNKKQKDDSLRCQLPMIFILSRFAHYIKRLQTSYIGRPVDKATIQKELSDWMRQYVNQSTSIQPEMLGKTPLRDAAVHVEEDPKTAGAYLCHFSMVPHTLATEFTTTLSLVTKTETGE